MMTSKTGNSLKAFTLIEVLLAVVILAIGLVGVLRAYASLISASGRAYYYIDAVSLTKEKISDIEQKALEEGGFSAAESFSGVFNYPYDNFQWKYETADSGMKGLATFSLVVSGSGDSRAVGISTYVQTKEESK